MSIRQPLQTTIHTDDFRDGAYCFVVESVLLPQERVGMLTVSASAGYLLTTSLNKDAKREQTFDHSQQSDGSWIAKGSVTLIVTNGSPVDGTITVRNSGPETVILTINATDATSVSVEQWQQPTLSVSRPALVFAPTSPGKPSFLVLTIAQQHADAPVTLTTDAPEQFQLASDSRPTFLPALTLTPSVTGSYVHVRYSPQKNGVHTGQLLIHTSYEEKTVPLEGRSSRLLPALRASRSPNTPATLRRPILRRLTLRRSRSTEQSANQASASKQGLALLALVFVGGLAYAGYSNRHQLFVALYPDKETRQPTEKVNGSPSNPAVIHQTSEKGCYRRPLSGRQRCGRKWFRRAL